jgi:hypothetical protein
VRGRRVVLVVGEENAERGLLDDGRQIAAIFDLKGERRDVFVARGAAPSSDGTRLIYK